VAPPFKVVEFDIMYGEGISKTGELIDLGVRAGIVDKSGSWYSYKSTKLGQGKEASRIFLKESPNIAEEIEKAIRTNSGVVVETMTGESLLDNVESNPDVE
jgi:recombination protein RecA